MDLVSITGVHSAANRANIVRTGWCWKQSHEQIQVRYQKAKGSSLDGRTMSKKSILPILGIIQLHATQELGLHSFQDTITISWRSGCTKSSKLAHEKEQKTS